MKIDASLFADMAICRPYLKSDQVKIWHKRRLYLDTNSHKVRIF
jgi:hypothetical protein